MTDQIHAKLRPVRTRQFLQAIVRDSIRGLLIGVFVGIVLTLGRRAGLNVTVWHVAGASLVTTLLAVLFSVVRNDGWLKAASVVDAHYGLKDRAVSALSFLRREQQSATNLHKLQIEDAVLHLDCINPVDVAPLSMPRTLPIAAIGLVAMIVLLLVPVSDDPRVLAGSPRLLPHIRDEATRLEQTVLEEIRALIDEPSVERKEDLEQLVKQLQQLTEEMKESGVDVRQALVKLSQMQNAITEVRRQFDLTEVDTQLRALGDALKDAKPTREAAEALKNAQYDQAAKQLEELDTQELSLPEATTVSDKLKKLAEQMQELKQSELAEASEQMAEGLENEDFDQAEEGAKDLAGICRSQQIRKSISQRLGSQLARLAESKSICSVDRQSNQNEGNGRSKSRRPDDNWGRGATNEPLGEEPTRIESVREQVKLQGTHGDGPSQRELSYSPDGDEDARRSYREQFQKYQKMSEAVLQNETLPLGHRQTIRRYFQTIRPSKEEMELIGDDG